MIYFKSLKVPAWISAKRKYGSNRGDNQQQVIPTFHYALTGTRGVRDHRPVPTVAQAMALIIETIPNAAILDVQLGGETTFAIAERLDELAIPLMFLSGHPVTDFRDQLAGRTVLTSPRTGDLCLERSGKYSRRHSHGRVLREGGAVPYPGA